MKKTLLTTLAATALLGAGVASAAEFSANVTLTSDYSFRGWSQTMRDPAIQGGFDAAFDTGFSVGTWASNVNFGGSETMEWDFYVGWSRDLSEDVTLDITAIHFDYPGERGALNYQEVAASVSFGDMSVSVNYSPEYLGTEGVSFIYPAISYSKSISEDMTGSVSVGFNKASSPSGDFFGDSDQYVDVAANLSWSTAAGIDVSVGLVGTNNKDCGDDCELRPVFSLSKSL